MEADDGERTGFGEGILSFLSSLRFRLLLLVALASGPALGVVLHDGLERRREALGKADADAARAARAAAVLRERAFDEARQLLNTLALLDEVRARDGPRAAATFRGVLPPDGRFRNVGLLDDRGACLGAAREGGFSADPACFQKALQSRRFSVGSWIPAGPDGVETVQVAHPLLDPGGSVSAVLVLSVAAEYLGRGLDYIDLPPGSTIQLLDERAQVVASHPPVRRAPGARGALGIAAPGQGGVETGSRMVGPDGVIRRCGFAPLRSGGEVTGTLVVVGVPEASVAAPAEANLLRSLLLVAALGLSALLASWLFGRWVIVDRVDGLLKATRRLAGGEIRARRRMRRPGGGELAQLENAFDEMALSLERRTEDLQRAETRYRDLLERMPVVFYEVRPGAGGGVEYIGPGIGALTGFGVEAWRGRPGLWEERVDRRDRARARAALGVDGGGAGAYDATYRFHRADGTVCWLRDSGVRTVEGDRIVLRGFLGDVSAHKTLEAEFQQAQKMEALGRLSAVVAHDFNNLLTVIGGYSQLLQARLPGDPQARSQAEEIARAAERAGVLTRQLLHFSRRQQAEPVSLDANEALAGIEKLLRRLVGDRVSIETDFTRGPCPVFMDRGHLDQVIMNLTVNARDAMPGGGRILLRTRRVPGPGEPPEAPPTWVEISHADNGVGMDESVKSRIFEPFFTTKEEGKGTGLGLATVLDLTRGAGGRVDVESAPGKGTTFRILLPLHAEEGAAAPAPEAARSERTVRRRILLVEDDAAIRGFSREFLEGEGHTVKVAATAGEGRRAAAEGAFDLLLADVSLPDGDGGAMAGELALRSPGLRVILMSGFAPHLLDDQGLALPEHQFLQKPFRPADLRAAIGRAFAPAG